VTHLLGAEALHLEFPAGVIFDSLSLGINEGDRIGIVGRNGDGKSTLLRLLAGRLEPDSGRVTMRRGTTIGTLDQSDALDGGMTVGRAIVGESEEHVWAGDPRVFRGRHLSRPSAVVSAAGWPWRRRWLGTMTSCSWMSRRTTWTLKALPGSRSI